MEVITQIKVKKASGPDSIPAEVVRAVSLELPETVLNIMNRCLRHGELLVPRRSSTGPYASLTPLARC